ncbi:MAG TPA: metallophosphoesterase [Chitinophaga sp.]|uniref:metallophosphoesterase n=1 Tax=Chitinophaga sp. TaxID=1869181 RepID=UPI002C397CE6|nr:metallophosphoesterase [Chitinophaga sp.]HVI45759.1 metallophosphoesterase [Chitinophaga sp.]
MKKIFARCIIWLSNRMSSKPNRIAVFNSLSKLRQEILDGKTERGLRLTFDHESTRYIIFSDQHKGARDAADDFMAAEENYLGALSYYYNNNFTFVNLGDCEELWESTPAKVMEKNRLALLEEARFQQQERYFRIFGNHDLEWKYALPQQQFLHPIFGKQLKVYEGLILSTRYNEKEYQVFLTHGHQGDQRSDGNAFSKWFVAAIWTPIQRFFDIHTDTLSDSFDLVDQHNLMMHEWSVQYSNTLLIAGHTHKPVFASLDHIDRLNRQLQRATAKGGNAEIKKINDELLRRQAEYAGKRAVKTKVPPTYFNTGCCCFSDGDITGIEIAEGYIRLVKWEKKTGNVTRMVLEESPLYYLFDML